MAKTTQGKDYDEAEMVYLVLEEAVEIIRGAFKDLLPLVTPAVQTALLARDEDLKILKQVARDIIDSGNLAKIEAELQAQIAAAQP